MGGIPEIIQHDTNGYLVEVDAIGDYMSWLLILFSNKEIYEKMKFNNIEKSKHYTVDKMTDSYVEIYKKMGVQTNER